MNKTIKIHLKSRGTGNTFEVVLTAPDNVIAEQAICGPSLKDLIGDVFDADVVEE